MAIKNHSTKRKTQKHDKQEKKTSGIMKFFYIVMLFLMVSIGAIGILGSISNTSQNANTPAPQSIPVSGGGTSALVLIFHQENSSSGQCVDLTITFTGSAVYSDCSKDVNTRYTLSASEQTQLHGLINQFQPINYDHTDKTQAGNVTNKLYLNGQGNQQAGNVNTQQIINFATALTTKIASQPQSNP
jgi:hypothetical protein